METATSADAERPVVDAEGALRFLAEASNLLGGSLDYSETVRRVADLIVPQIADWCGIEVPDLRGGELRVTAGPADPQAEEFAAELARRPTAAQGTAAAVQKGEVSFLSVPLFARGRTLGSMTLVSRRADRRYGSMDITFAEHLGRRFALAIDNARLYDEAGRSLALLDTLFATAPVGLAFFDTELRYVRINEALAAINGLPIEEHIGRRLVEVLPEAGPDFAEMLSRVVATGEPITDVEVQLATQRDPGNPRLFNASYYPVRSSDGQITGLGAVVAEITERQRAAIELAQALEGEREARAAAEAAERRARFLAEASGLLDVSLDYETTLQSVARLVVSQMADWCAIDMVGQTGIDSVAVAHVDPEKVKWARAIQERYPPDLDAPTGVPNVLRTGKSELYQNLPSALVEAAAVDDEHLTLIRQLELRSVMVVPMVARGRTLGAISFVGAESGRTFDETDLALAEELARRAAMAVDNARLYTELSGIADTLQAELLPTEIPDIPGIEVAVRYRAAGELNRVGGDFYDVFGRGLNEWAVVIGDVSGKGAPAAAVTALARYTLRTAAITAETPSKALDSLNEALLERRRDQEFCSVALAFVTLRDGGLDVRLSLGGHPPALVRRADGMVETIGSPGLLMGFAHNPPLSDDDLRLEPGDTMIFYTDGVTDAARDGDRFGDGRLTELTRELPLEMPASELAATIEATAVEFAGHQPQDDMALVALKVPSAFVRAAQYNVGGGPEAIGRARTAITEFFRGELARPRLYALHLLVSEVVTNAVHHGGARQGEQVDLRIALSTDLIRLEVRDPGPGFLELAPPVLPESDQDGGYGLYIVDLYSSDWGISGTEGTCVWFEVPLEDPAEAG